jgi:hypothetical protein
VEPKRFQLEGPSLAALRTQVAAEHGPRARIVAAEKVTVGGIRGFFSRQHFEVTVEVAPAAGTDETRRGRRARLDIPARLGIAALLADADETEARIQGKPPEAVVSTVSGDFAALMDDLTFNTVRPQATPVPAPPALQPAPAPIPSPLRGVGDLVVVIGLHRDAAAVAASMAAVDALGDGNSVEFAGALAGSDPDWDRRRALSARANGVERGRAVFVAFGLHSARNPAALAVQADTLLAIGADQTWVAVDAGRKAADTARWVSGLAALLPLDAIAVVGTDATSSPETVDLLPLPVGWVDGVQAPPRRARPDKLA